MADTRTVEQTAQQAGPKAVPGPSQRVANAPAHSPKVPGLRIEFSALAGIALALSGIVGGLLLEKGSIHDIVQGTAAMIVLGGTLGAVLLTTPMPVFRRALRALTRVFFDRSDSPSAVVETLILFAAKARKNGIVSLEHDAESVSEPFLRKALNLAVDGTDLQEIRKMMEVELDILEQRAEAEARVWESAGGYSPTIGIIGAVLGLIQVMKHLEEIKEVGHGIAVAFVATVYGVGAANLFFLPVANKLRARARRNALLHEMTLEGVAGIVEGLNPKLIRMKLECYDRDSRPAAKPKPGGIAEAAKLSGGAASPRSAPAGTPQPPGKRPDVIP